MPRATTFLGSSIGQKVVMAVTGLVLYGFVIGHMVGNLQLYLGPEGDQRLRRASSGTSCTARASGSSAPALLVAVGFHVWAAVTLTLANWARPARRLPRVAGARVDLRLAHDVLERADPRASSSSTTSLHFTLGHRAPRVRRGRRLPQRRHRLLEPASCRRFYILAMLALGLHLFHGFWSMFQTLGLEPPAVRTRCDAPLSWLLAVLVVAGNISIPMAVLAGLVHL